MTDFTELKDGWGEPDPPSPTARATARAALMREITATHAPEPRRRGGRLGWLVSGTVVAAALAVVLSPARPGQPTPPEQHASRSSPSPDELSGQQILLQAAEVAGAQPEGTGAYWHVLQEIHDADPEATWPVQRLHEWTTRDGAHYNMPDGYPGASQIILDIGFFVGGSLLTLERVEGLPTNPDELKTLMSDHGSGLSRLLWEVPAPPAVRSAALRALATMPNVSNLGTVDGAQALRIFFDAPAADKFPDGKLPPGAGEMTLVINPDTATLVSFTTYQGTTKILAAGWTDEMPEIIPAN